MIKIGDVVYNELEGSDIIVLDIIEPQREPYAELCRQIVYRGNDGKKWSIYEFEVSEYDEHNAIIQDSPKKPTDATILRKSTVTILQQQIDTLTDRITELEIDFLTRNSND